MDDKNVARLWQYDEPDFSELLNWLDSDECKVKPDVVHIQYSEGFYTLTALAHLIEGLKAREVKVILTAHGLQVEGIDYSVAKDALDKLDQIQALNPKDVEFLHKELGLKQAIYIPHGNVTIPLQAKSRLQKKLGFAAGSEGDAPTTDNTEADTTTENDSEAKLPNTTHGPIIGMHGFMSEGKGILETLEAFALLKKDLPGAKLLAVNAVNPRNVTSAGMRDTFLDKAKQLGVSEDVLHIGDFLDKEEVIVALAACDICVFAYPEAKQTASGAVKLALAAGRPIITTKSFQMEDMQDIAYVIDNNSPDVISQAVSTLWQDKQQYYKYLLKCLTHKDYNSWERVSLTYLYLLSDI